MLHNMNDMWGLMRTSRRNVFKRGGRRELEFSTQLTNELPAGERVEDINSARRAQSTMRVQFRVGSNRLSRTTTEDDDISVSDEEDGRSMFRIAFDEP